MWLSRVGEREGFPIAPGGVPIFGHLPTLLMNTQTMHKRARQECGDFYWLHHGFNHWQLMYSHSDAVQLFKTKAADSSYMRNTSSEFLGESMIVMDGPPHTKVRSAFSPTFNPKGLTTANVGEVVSQVMSARVERWKTQDSVDVVPETREMALDIIFRMIGIPSEDLSAWRHQYEEFLMILIRLPINLPGLPLWRGRRAAAWLKERLSKLVREARQKPEAHDLLGRLAHARDEDGQWVEEEHVVDNLRLLALAGHETTASTMAWMTLHLGKEPQWWEALVEEARAVGQPPMSPAELRKFPVAESIFREALRLHPPVAADARIVVGDLDLQGRRVPIGTTVGIPICLLCRDPEAFPEPELFRPERWTGRTLSPLETIAFGSGPHFCLGYHVAWMEAVHFAVRLALSLSAMGKRPKAPEVIKEHHVPFMRPHSKTKLFLVS